MGVGFIIGVIQDSCETGVNSSTDVLYTAIADYRDRRLHPERYVDEPFNPEMHNAVMHIDSEEAGENEVVEVFMKVTKEDLLLR